MICPLENAAIRTDKVKNYFFNLEKIYFEEFCNGKIPISKINK